MTLNKHGQVVQHAGFFTESMPVFDFHRDGQQQLIPRPLSLPEPLALEESILKALVLGVRDYVRKNNFSGVLLGLSGGIDSALTAALP